MLILYIMDIKFTEIDNFNNNENNIDYNSEKYWEHSEIKNEKKPKKVTYDDILSSLNMVVNKNGVLQYMELNKNNEIISNNTNKIVEPQFKNSYIYNKYFKDYTDNNKPTIEIRKPKTIEEYKNMLLEDKINRIQARNRISQIKSTKLLFENTGSIKVNRHKLNKMNFNMIYY